MKAAYKRKLELELEEKVASDPNDFWNQIKNLGPKRLKEENFEVYDENGNVTNDINVVLKEWEKCTKNLFTTYWEYNLGREAEYLSDIVNAYQNLLYNIFVSIIQNTIRNNVVKETGSPKEQHITKMSRSSKEMYCISFKELLRARLIRIAPRKRSSNSLSRWLSGAIWAIWDDLERSGALRGALGIEITFCAGERIFY